MLAFVESGDAPVAPQNELRPQKPLTKYACMSEGARPTFPSMRSGLNSIWPRNMNMYDSTSIQ